MTSLYLSDLFTDPSSTYSHFLRCRVNFEGRDRAQPQHVIPLILTATQGTSERARVPGSHAGHHGSVPASQQESEAGGEQRLGTPG